MSAPPAIRPRPRVACLLARLGPLLARLAPFSLLALLAAPAHADDCDDLALLALGHVEIASAASIAPGAFTPPGAAGRAGRFGGAAYAGLPAFCRVELVSRPAADSSIGIEVWLPAAG